MEQEINIYLLIYLFTCLFVLNCPISINDALIFLFTKKIK